MTLSCSTRLGPYEILAPLGAGGMGEVYRARDTRLDRTVAIKVLPSHLSDNDEFRQRFEREARAVSSLNHPHICALYDVGHQDGIDYLVMEFIEGSSLADRLAKSALPAEQVLRYAIQIADALDKAHRAGIVHRDLKPGNIMVTKSGTKLLDFGLAKFRTPDSQAVFSNISEVSTELVSLTAESTIVGTLAYMAPEQLSGKDADARTDIFAFGVVVYEMATGKRAFSSESQANLIGAILHTEPPAISTIRPMTPPALDRVVKKCLAKDPDERWQTACDLMDELKWIAEAGSQAGMPAPVMARRMSRERWAWIMATGLLAFGLLVSLPFTLAHFGHGPVDVPALRFNLPPPEKSTFRFIALSPDGRRLAFVAADPASKALLYLRPLDALNAQPLPGTDGASYPFWSPDSRFIGFFANGKLKKIEVSGGPAQALCNAPTGRGGTWNRDGVIVFAPGPNEGLYRVSAAGGEPSPLTTPDQSRQESSHRWPQFLPDGRSFLYFTLGGDRGIYAGSLDSKETKRLLGTDSSGVYASPGYLFFRREATLMAQAFDLQKLQLAGDPFPIAEHIGSEAGTYHTYLTISENGVLAYHSGDTEKTQLVWFDRGGKQLGVIGSPGEYFNPALSLDGKRIAFNRTDPQTSNRDVWLLELTRGTTSRLTFDRALNWFPVWSPDSSRIVFASNRGGLNDLYQKAASGAGSDELLLKSSNSKFPIDWSLDGRFILYDCRDAKTKADIWVLPLEGDRQPFPFLQTKFNEQQARFSPNGRWIAYTSDESGTLQVYVQSFPASGSKWQVSTGGGDEPRWRRDGKELFYLAADGKLMAVEVKTAGTFEAGVPKPLFEIGSPSAAAPFQNSYAVTADGQRFLVRSALEQTTSTVITVVVNWTAETKR